jgi:hypothetical protein
MRTVDEALEIVFAALRDVPAPLGMNRRILDRCSYWRSIRCRPPNAKHIQKVEPISPRVLKRGLNDNDGADH